MNYFAILIIFIILSLTAQSFVKNDNSIILHEFLYMFEIFANCVLKITTGLFCMMPFFPLAGCKIFCKETGQIFLVNFFVSAGSNLMKQYAMWMRETKFSNGVIIENDITVFIPVIITIVLVLYLLCKLVVLQSNSKNKEKEHNNSRPIVSIKQKITGKDKLIRGHIQGKRNNQSNGTVLSIDPDLYHYEETPYAPCVNNYYIPRASSPYVGEPGGNAIQHTN